MRWQNKTVFAGVALGMAAACGAGLALHRLHAASTLAEVPAPQTLPAPSTVQAAPTGDEQDVASLHARENLLLENYTWANEEHTRVRIPIDRAMELLAARGLPVTPASNQPRPMTGDGAPRVTAPLTNGFAPTGYEQGQR